MQEEIEQKSFNIMISTTKLSARTVLNAVKAAIRLYQSKAYHSHAATIYKWAQEDAAKGKAAPKQGIPDYSCKEGESL